MKEFPWYNYSNQRPTLNYNLWEQEKHLFESISKDKKNYIDADFNLWLEKKHDDRTVFETKVKNGLKEMVLIYDVEYSILKIVLSSLVVDQEIFVNVNNWEEVENLRKKLNYRRRKV